MAIVGFNIKKVEAERKGHATGKININNNIKILNVVQTDLSLGKAKEAGLVFTFEFKTIYSPAIGEITLSGEVVYLVDAKRNKEIMDSWKKDKTVNDIVTTEILNAALTKCNIEAIIIARDIGLPSPIPFPRVDTKKR